jgi:hypothetical protein
MATSGRKFLDIPTVKGIRIAVLIIVVSMPLGYFLYRLGDKGWTEYVLKIGDCCVQGALIAILFGILKGVIDKADKADWQQGMLFWRKEPDTIQSQPSPPPP